MQKLILNFDRFSVEITGEHETELIKKAALWFSIPKVCPKCGSAVVLDYTNPQTFEYYKLKCTGKTPHSVNLGEKKITSDLYYDPRKSWEAFNATQTEDHTEAAREAAAAPEHANRPDSNRGQLLNEIVKLSKECTTRGLDGGVDVAGLGKRPDAELIQIRGHLLNALGQPA